MRNQNPVFSKINTGTTHYEDIDAASYKGITIKTGILLGVTALVAIIVAMFLPRISNLNGLIVALFAASIIGFVSAMVGRLSSRAAKYAGVIYATCQGLLLGTVSAICELYFPGVGTLAAFSTILLFGVMLLLYATGVLRQGSFIRKILYVIAISTVVVALFSYIFLFFVPTTVSIWIIIGIEALFLIYGAITLMFNFDEATAVVKAGCTKNEEWSVSLGLIVSLIYIYIECLRLIMYLVAIFGDRN